MNIITEKIRVARLTKGYSQHYMAVQLNIGQNAYCKIECGKTKLSLKRFLAISRILEIDSGKVLTEVRLTMEVHPKY
jgi:transcriptional regulator with XRE-family HTH domain